MDSVRLDPPSELTMPIGEAMFSQRATRRLDPDRPVTDAQLQIILDAASKAPNGGNTQPARYLVLPALLADEMVNAPAVILVYSEVSGVAASSTFPGVQNLLLSARALGLGSVLTTLHPQVMERVNAMFGVPENMVFHCCIPIGYPRGKFGPTSRLPTSATTSWERWGQPPPWK